MMGTDQHALNLNDSARLLYASHKGSFAISETITASLRYMAVPQEPAEGPMERPSTNCKYFSGSLGLDKCFNVLSFCKVNTELNISGCISSTPFNKLFIT